MTPPGIEIDKEYAPQIFETRWYDFWVEKGWFRAGRPGTGAPFTIVMPPPNITGSLHLGHALNMTLQDIIIRWRRMQGRDALWLPGTDHAGIATQMVVERDLRARGLSRHDIGREAFIEEVWRWKKKHGDEIIATLRRIGASCDWSRLRFTLDEGLSRAVREVFVTLFEEGRIYRAEDLINWCPSCRTALSDLEVETDEGRQGTLWEIAYPLVGEEGRRIIVATTRPETMLGDTAVAIHPEDDRYRGLAGHEAILPLIERRIPIVADPILVDPAFGTGAVKVTPAHDFNDFETGKRHGLPLISVLDEAGRVNAAGGPYAGLDRFEARERILQDLRDRGLLVGAKDHVLAVRTCQRCATIVEPFFSKQWFVRVEPLAGPALEAVASGRIGFVPEAWKKTYFEWMRKIHDWCISRQLWWGHRIPAWYCGDGHLTVAREEPGACVTCGAGGLRQDEDVLDTWFSSALWPFSTLGWPDSTDDLRRYYPTSVLSTGPDIIFFWVARMIMMGLRFAGDVPFQQVYFHSIVRDAHGQKMSKTRGNVIDPEDLFRDYGADPVRLTLAIQASPGSDINFQRERMEGYRAFANKLWNASRFVLMHAEAADRLPEIERGSLTAPDRWILGGLSRLCREVDEDLETFRFDLAANRIYQFIWHEYCDWYIEWIKPALFAPDGPGTAWTRGAQDGAPPASGPDRIGPARREQVRAVLIVALERLLRLLHPFMPYLTEELWQKIPGHGVSIAVSEYPAPDPSIEDPGADAEMAALIELVGMVRNLRSESGIDPARRIRLLVHPQTPEDAVRLERNIEAIRSLTRCDTIETVADLGSAGAAARGLTERFEVAVPLEGLLDLGAESRRLHRERDKIQKEIGTRARKLSDDAFLARAPAPVVDKEKAIHAELSEKLRRIDRILTALGG